MPPTGKYRQRPKPYDRSTVPVAVAAAPAPPPPAAPPPGATATAATGSEENPWHARSVQLADGHWTLQPIDVLHFITVLQHFARQFGDEQLTKAINAIIEELKPGEMAKNPEDIFQEVQRAIKSLADPGTKTVAQATAAAAAAVTTVYRNYSSHVLNSS